MSEKNSARTKYFKTEPNYPSNKLNKEIIKQFNYRLFIINEENRKIHLNNLDYNKKEMKVNMIIKSQKNENFNNTNNYFLKTLKTFSNIALRNSINKTNNYLPNRNIGNISKRKNNRIFYEKSIKNNTNNQKLCLVPVFLFHKNKIKKNEIDLINIRKNIYSAKSSKRKNTNRILNDFLNKKNKRRNETEENDMKPKIRFINFKKDLLDENLKINKMFGNYQRQIIELEKEIKGQINHLYI